MKKIVVTLYVLKAIRLAMAISIIIAVASCSKEKTGNPTAPARQGNKKLVKTTYVYNNGSPEYQSFSYDGENRLSSYSNNNYSYNFTYTSSSLINVTRKKNNSIDQHIECSLNSNGVITKMLYKDLAGTVTCIQEYEYNSDGYLIKEKGSYPGSYSYEESFIIENGNAISSKLYYDGILYNTRSYYYDMAKLNKTPFSHAGKWASDYLFGKPSKNIHTEYKDYDKNGVLAWHSRHSYVLDADGFIIKHTTDYVLQGTQSVMDCIFQ